MLTKQQVQIKQNKNTFFYYNFARTKVAGLLQLRLI